jgi:alkanesulfonate monooxygenase SsuD/methylene tetrahydromethanopterin reductase-like flavin-dependent oxidoreductase (luciferase family)
MDRDRAAAIFGTGPEVAARLRAVAAETGVDELVVTGMAYDEAARRESFAIIAREFGLIRLKIAA